MELVRRLLKLHKINRDYYKCITKGLRQLLPDFAWTLLVQIHIHIRAFLFYSLRCLKIQSNKIVVSNLGGKAFGDNGKYIVLELLNRDSRRYDIVWLANNVNDESFPLEVRVVKYGSMKSIYELATAKIWIDNSRKNLDVRKRKNQYYIHTGHGGIILKKVERDAEECLDKFYVKKAQHDSEMIDIIISNSKWRTKLLRESYWYSGKIYEWGIPKMDSLTENKVKKKEKVYHNLKLQADTKIALYAPTFRKDRGLDQYNLELNTLKNKLQSKFGGNWVVAVRLHPNIMNMSADLKIPQNIINVTYYPDMQELLIACEILITDYSGTMFEALLYLDKIVFLYANDLTEYDRGFYFDIYKLPFPLAQNNEEVWSNIKNFDYVEYKQKTEFWKKYLGFIERTDSSKRIADQIDNICF